MSNDRLLKNCILCILSDKKIQYSALSYTFVSFSCKDKSPHFNVVLLAECEV